MLDATQYRDRPLGREKEKNMSIIGMSQSIIWVVCAWRGSAGCTVVVFCTAHMDTPTSTGSTKRGGSARSSHRKRLSRGMASFTRGSQAYSFWASPASRSGWSGRVWMMAW